MKMSAKATAALNRVIQRFQSGDLGPIIQTSLLHWPEDLPAAKWTSTNRVLAMAQTDHLDNRGYRQWQDAGRQVQSNTRAAFIIGPRTRKEPDPNNPGEERTRLVGWRTIPVYSYTDTQPVDSTADPLIYEPAEPPPLADVAESWNIPIHYGPTNDPSTRGSFSYTLSGEPHHINLHTHDMKTFFHELAHAADTKLGNMKETAGQDPQRETTAELAACCLSQMYGLDTTANSWSYIECYNDDPLTAIVEAISAVSEILDLIIHTSQNQHNPEAKS